MPVSDAVKNLHAALKGIEDHLPLLDDPANSMATAKAATQAAEEHKSQIELQIRSRQAELDRQLAEGEQKLLQQKAEFNNQAKAHADQLSALQSRRSELDSDVKALQTRHDSILASFESLKKKIA